jgi:hypothetical protein
MPSVRYEKWPFLQQLCYALHLEEFPILRRFPFLAYFPEIKAGLSNH